MKTNQSIFIRLVFVALGALGFNTVSICQNANASDTTKANGMSKNIGTDKTSLGTIISAAVGGTTGAVIGLHMDAQANEMKLAIPEAQIERVGEGIVIEFNHKILFGFDKSRLTALARNSLSKLKEILQKYPDTNIEVQGHTDEYGTIKYNQALSERRASAVIGNLSENDIATARLTLKGYGESLPKYTNKTVDGLAHNRRVELLVSANTKMVADAVLEAK